MLDINPLNILQVRKLHNLAPHFAKTKLNEEDFFSSHLESWIEKKLKGRYFLIKTPSIIDNVLKTQTFIGFENHTELTYFLLSCPYLRRN